MDKKSDLLQVIYDNQHVGWLSDHYGAGIMKRNPRFIRVIRDTLESTLDVESVKSETVDLPLIVRKFRIDEAELVSRKFDRPLIDVPPYAVENRSPLDCSVTYHWIAALITLDQYEWLFDRETFIPTDTMPALEEIKSFSGMKPTRVWLDEYFESPVPMFDSAEEAHAYDPLDAILPKKMPSFHIKAEDIVAGTVTSTKLTSGPRLADYVETPRKYGKSIMLEKAKSEIIAKLEADFAKSMTVGLSEPEYSRSGVLTAEKVREVMMKLESMKR